MSCIILGLDISSKTIGYSVISIDDNKNISILEISQITPIKQTKTKTQILKNNIKKTKTIITKLDIFQQLNYVKNEINKILKKYNPDIIGIEDIAKYFPNKSSANTIITLALYNRTIGLECFNFKSQSPNLCNVLSIRTKIKKQLKLNKIPDKKEIPDCMEKILNIKFPYIYDKNKNINEKSYDMADSLAVAYYMVR